jgi:hypothetical protein
VHWVPCKSHEFREPLPQWLARMVLKDPTPIKTPLELIRALPKDRAATIFLDHSEMLFLNPKNFACEFLDNLAEAIKVSGRGDINIIFANSRPENAKAVLESDHILLLGPPDCSRWKEEHVKAFIDQRLWGDSKWTAEDKELLTELGTTAGAVGFIEVWTHTDPKRLSNLMPSAKELGMRWNALKSEGVLSYGRGNYWRP